MSQHIRLLVLLFFIIKLSSNPAFAFLSKKNKQNNNKKYTQLIEAKAGEIYPLLQEPSVDRPLLASPQDPLAVKKILAELLSNPEHEAYHQLFDLLDSLENINEPLPNNSRALELALSKPNKTYLNKLVQKLLSMGADVNLTDVEGWTPLMLALGHAPDLDIVLLLLDNGAQINVVNNNGSSPLMALLRHAPKHAYLELFHLLLEKKADITVVNKNNMNALFFAHYMNKQDAFAQLLLLGEDAGACRQLEISSELKLSLEQSQHYIHDMNEINKYIKASLNQKDLLSGFAGRAANIVRQAAASLHKRHLDLLYEANCFYPGIFEAVALEEIILQWQD